MAECCGVAATISQDDRHVIWQLHGDRWNRRELPSTIVFDREQYLFTIAWAWADRRWERPARTTARLVQQHFALTGDRLREFGCSRVVAAARVRSNDVHVWLYFAAEDLIDAPPFRRYHLVFADDETRREVRASLIIDEIARSDPRGRLPDADSRDQMHSWRTW